VEPLRIQAKCIAAAGRKPEEMQRYATQKLRVPYNGDVAGQKVSLFESGSNSVWLSGPENEIEIYVRCLDTVTYVCPDTVLGIPAGVGTGHALNVYGTPAREPKTSS
jgi:hypothetical protein